jgi:hypothetical protein
MKFRCEIDNIRTIKKGVKITLTVPDTEKKEFMQHIINFDGMPLTLEVLTDAAEQQKKLNQITPEQRKKIYVLIKDIAEYTGNGKDNEKDNMKAMFCSDRGIESFSLSDCETEIAGSFIEWLIEFCFEHGISLSENPQEGLSDIESYLRICIKKSKCCICGKDGTVYNGSKNTQISLCNLHATKLKNDGFEKFKETFKVWGV